MKELSVVIATDFHIDIIGSQFYVKTQFSTILERYYKAFGKLKICARYNCCDAIDKSSVNVTDMIDSLLKISSLEKAFLGLYNNQIYDFINDTDLIIGRLPSVIANKVFNCANDYSIKTMVEVMGDAWDSYWNHGMIGKLFAPYMHLKTKNVVNHADYAVYVTSYYLQKKYPCSCESISASNVLLDNLSENALLNREKSIIDNTCDTLSLMTTASVDVRHKGQEFVIKAIPLLNKKGIQVKYYLAGGGDKTFLSELATKLGVIDQVVFLGRLSLDEIFTYLDCVDIYIQPSLQEGLPRSLIEALSRGCLCLGAKTAGIPELIEDRFVFERRSPKGITDAIININNCTVPEKIQIAKNNYEKAQAYTSMVLDERRNRYYKTIIENVSDSFG